MSTKALRWLVGGIECLPRELRPAEARLAEARQDREDIERMATHVERYGLSNNSVAPSDLNAWNVISNIARDAK